MQRELTAQAIRSLTSIDTTNLSKDTAKHLDETTKTWLQREREFHRQLDLAELALSQLFESKDTWWTTFQENLRAFFIGRGRVLGVALLAVIATWLLRTSVKINLPFARRCIERHGWRECRKLSATIPVSLAALLVARSQLLPTIVRRSHRPWRSNTVEYSLFSRLATEAQRRPHPGQLYFDRGPNEFLALVPGQTSATKEPTKHSPVPLAAVRVPHRNQGVNDRRRAHYICRIGRFPVAYLIAAVVGGFGLYAASVTS
ncbi:MAG: hypothetical protein ACI8W7_003079, partial [Gammaproteobacteria bacterium]